MSKRPSKKAIPVWMISELWCRLADLDRTLLDFSNASAEQERAAA